jgi:hypothetical protein
MRKRRPAMRRAAPTSRQQALQGGDCPISLSNSSFGAAADAARNSTAAPLR